MYNGVEPILYRNIISTTTGCETQGLNILEPQISLITWINCTISYDRTKFVVYQLFTNIKAFIEAVKSTGVHVNDTSYVELPGICIHISVMLYHACTAVSSVVH